jgi:hypothetical protein
VLIVHLLDLRILDFSCAAILDVLETLLHTYRQGTGDENIRFVSIIILLLNSVFKLMRFHLDYLEQFHFFLIGYVLLGLIIAEPLIWLYPCFLLDYIQLLWKNGCRHRSQPSINVLRNSLLVSILKDVLNGEELYLVLSHIELFIVRNFLFNKEA